MSLRNSVKMTATCLCCAVLVAACGGSSGDDAASGEVGGSITMRTYPVIADEGDEAFWDEQVAAFEEEHPDVDVTVDIQPWAERDKALTTAIAGGTAPDIVYMIPDEVTQFQDQGVLEPLDGVLDTEGYRDNALSAVSIDGELFAAPILMSVIPGVCDAKVLEEVGIDEPPKTWDDLMAMGPKFEAKGKYVTHIIASNESTLNTTFYPWVWQAGGDVFADDGEATIDSPAMIEATQFLAELADKGYVNRDEATTNLPVEQSPVGRREVGCLYYAEPILLEGVWGDDIVVAPPLTNEGQAAYGTVGSYAMLNTSENKATAAAWLDFITSEDVMAALDKAAGYYPPKETVTVDFPEGSMEAQTAEYLDLANPGPTVGSAREVQGVIAPAVQAAVLGSKTAEQAMSDAAAAAEPITARN